MSTISRYWEAADNWIKKKCRGIVAILDVELTVYVSGSIERLIHKYTDPGYE